MLLDLRPICPDKAGMDDTADKAAFMAHANVSRETSDKIHIYVRLLREWQEKMNLVGPSTLGEIWTRHILDSYQLLALGARRPEGLPANKIFRIVDLGSGAGFPGMVLAMCGAGDVCLVESDQKKASFLEIVSRETSTPVRIYPERAERLPTFGADVVTARAMAPLEKLLPHAHHHLKKVGVALFMKGRQWATEVEAAQKGWAFALEQRASLTAPDSAILRLTAIKPAEKKRGQR